MCLAVLVSLNKTLTISNSCANIFPVTLQGKELLLFSSNFFTLKIHPTKTLDLALVMRNMPCLLYSRSVNHTITANEWLQKLPSHLVTRPDTHYPTPLSLDGHMLVGAHVTLPTGQLKSLYSLLSALGKGIANWPRIGCTHRLPCMPRRWEEVIPTICRLHLQMADYVHYGPPLIQYGMYDIPVNLIMRFSANVYIVNIV